MTNLEKLAVIVSADISIDAAIRKMAAQSAQVLHAGIALVLDPSHKLLGVFTDGDIRRAYARDVDFSEPVSEIMISDPVAVSNRMAEEDILPEVYRLVRQKNRLNSPTVPHILVTDDDGRLVNIHSLFDLMREQDYRFTSVAVFGMGYVGLTLAVSLANLEHMVSGIDVDEAQVTQLSEGQPHILEPGLEDMLRHVVARNTLRFSTNCETKHHSVYIVAVGTPLKPDGKPDVSALESVAQVIGPKLERGNLVMLRSTVPAGFTRGTFIPMLEQLSGMVAGEDFHVAFTPERTVEGQAMRELRTLPQIVGGLTSRCTRRATTFWSTLTHSVVQVDNLEAAEMVKLANNSFRDLSFAFSNSLALLADTFNVDAASLVRAANEGYPRNPIPVPSPGVGGYCLTKDPLLMAHSGTDAASHAVLARAAREANDLAAQYPVEIVEKFARRIDRNIADLTILLVGIAFKGEPETNDMRHSPALITADKLKRSGARILAWDAVIPVSGLREAGLEADGDLRGQAAKADAVLFLNNHKNNTPPGLFQDIKGPRLIFDGWSQLDPSEIEHMNGFVYATMGYLTPLP